MFISVFTKQRIRRMLVKLNKDLKRQRALLRLSYIRTCKKLVNLGPLPLPLCFTFLHLMHFSWGKLHVPVWELIWKLDDLCDGFRISFRNAAHVQFAVALLLHFGDHSLESGAPPDGKEHLGRYPICNAFQAFFHKSFSLETEEKP